jgi:hypothetical protein
MGNMGSSAAAAGPYASREYRMLKATFRKFLRAITRSKSVGAIVFIVRSAGAMEFL